MQLCLLLGKTSKQRRSGEEPAWENPLLVDSSNIWGSDGPTNASIMFLHALFVPAWAVVVVF